jgi:putative ABC transport system permease protein
VVIAFHTALQLGLLYGIATLSTVVSFRFLRFPDLTVDGSFVVGAVTAAMQIRGGANIPVACTIAAACGFLAGVCTAVWNRLFGINKFFAGILTMMMLYSLNLRILGGANISLFGSKTLFSVSDATKTFAAFTMFGGVAAVVALVFCSRFGVQVRALGSNASAMPYSEARLTLLTVLALGFANSLAALAGSLVAQYQSFADVGMGLGVTVNVFASLFLGEGLLLTSAGFALRAGQNRSAKIRPFLAGAGAVLGELFAALIGMIVFMSILTTTLYLGLRPSDTKLVGGLLLLVGLVWRRGRRASFLVPLGDFER